HPVVETKHLVGSLIPFKEEAVRMSIAQRDHFAHGDGAKVWSATNLTLRPFIGLMIAAMFDPFETRLVKRVREAIFSLGHEPHPEGEKRQMGLHRVRIGAAGMVVDSDTGHPLVDVKVSVEGKPESTLTDVSGVFFFRNLPVGRHKLSFTKATYKSIEKEAVTPPIGRANEMELMDVKLASASDKERTDDLIKDPTFQVPGAELIGTLRFADGSAAAYIPVRINGRTAVTDGDGQYHFTNVQGPIKEIIAEIPGQGEVSKPIDASKPTVELGKK
ncbi:MAG: carboxypeptidase regulatory-like domain-containing protein, partial [Chlorobia bacterium]|nr:carboxypeptidase regulatory-like domain-containing protein [Fimbriimonadaceae bacterium]